MSEGKRRVEINGEWQEIGPSGSDASHGQIEGLAPGHFVVTRGQTKFEVFEQRGKLGDGRALDGVELRLESEKERIVRERFGGASGRAGAGATGIHVIKAPMPGMVRVVMVTAGDLVERTSTLVVLEAMKMENNILAGAAGSVTRVHAAVGVSVEKNAPLVEIELA